MIDLIVYAIPFFFLLIGVEYGLSWLARRTLYRFNDSVNDLSMGIADQVGGAFFASIAFVGYIVVWEHFRLFDMGAASRESLAGVPWWVWVTCFLAKDFGYYWAHRLAHELNVGWATHIAHHQSEEYNLTVALRQGMFQPFFFNIFYLPLAFIGFHPIVYIICSQINTIYQFWIHTRAIGKLGPLEWVMNTPSHHRVHHGRDAKYIDRNHAGVFIIWDRLFGTFQEEEEEPHYGLVTPLASWNPIWGQIHYFVRLAKLSWAAPRFADKLKVWYKPPAWAPEGLAPKVSSQELWEKGQLTKYNARAPKGFGGYVALHFVPLLLFVVGLLAGGFGLGTATYAIGAGLVLWTLVSLGGIFERKRWILVAEPLRLLVMTAVLVTRSGAVFGLPQLAGPLWSGVFVAMGLLSLLWLLSRRADFTEPIGRLFGAPIEAEEAHA